MRVSELLIIQSENKRLDYVENISKLEIYLLTNYNYEKHNNKNQIFSMLRKYKKSERKTNKRMINHFRINI